MKQGIPPRKPFRETLQENTPFSTTFLCKRHVFLFFRSRRGSPACITPRGNCPTLPVDAPKAIQPTTEQATREHGAVQPGPPMCTRNAATDTASQHLSEGPGALLPRHGHPSYLLAPDPGPNSPGILAPLLEPIRRGSPLYNLMVG